MPRVLVPVDDFRNARHALRHVVREFTMNAATEIHVLHVEPRLRRHVAQFIGRRDREAFHRDRTAEALRPVRQMLDGAGAPYHVHAEVGPKGVLIAATAARLACDCIVIGVARRSALLRLLEDAVVDQVLARTSVPVVVIAGEPVSMAERYGLPAGIGAVLALLLAAAAD
ncbi:MAG TPA: universal stress protein [Casimicrobiaceae bacterium]